MENNVKGKLTVDIQSLLENCVIIMLASLIINIILPDILSHKDK